MELRNIPGYPRYRVSDAGEVWSAPRPRTRGGRLKQSLVSGYPSVTLYAEGVGTRRSVHSLVAEAFLGPRPAGMEVRHLNGDGQDNRVANLEYGTHGENMLDRRGHGTDRNASKTHCRYDHEFTPENTYIRPNGARYCRRCGNDRSRARNQSAQRTSLS